MRARWIGVATLLVVLTGCTTTAPPDPEPPSVEVIGDRAVTLTAWAWCAEDRCADGSPPEVPADVGSSAVVTVQAARPGWTYTATSMSPGRGACGRRLRQPLTAVDGQLPQLKPHGPAGRYDVWLEGSHPTQGSLTTSFGWTTPIDGERPAPTARIQALAESQGRLDSYGLVLTVEHLDATPVEAEARLTFTAADGARLAVTLRPVVTEGCAAPGSLRFEGSEADRLALTRLAGRPVEYRVELVLDGTVHRATASWPDDQDPERRPEVPLTFNPPLPAWTS